MPEPWEIRRRANDGEFLRHHPSNAARPCNGGEACVRDQPTRAPTNLSASADAE
jgi:hypothetical protein